MARNKSLQLSWYTDVPGNEWYTPGGTNRTFPDEEIRVVIDRRVGGLTHRTILMGGMETQATDNGITLKCMQASVLDQDADEIVILSEKQVAKLFKWLEKRGLYGAHSHCCVDQDE